MSALTLGPQPLRWFKAPPTTPTPHRPGVVFAPTETTDAMEVVTNSPAGVVITGATCGVPFQPSALFKISGPAQAVAEVARQIKTASGSGAFTQPRQVWPRSFRSLPDGRVETEWSDVEVAREDVTYDQIALRHLIEIDDAHRQDRDPRERWTTAPMLAAVMLDRRNWTALQRDAVSAYHSDALRAKVKASAAADKARATSVVVDGEEW